MVKTSGGDGRQEGRKRSSDAPSNSSDRPRKTNSNPVESVFALRRKARKS